jgi:hypothetical protein
VTNKKISELPAATALTGTEQVPVVQGGVTKRATVAAVSQAPSFNVVAYGATGNGTTDDTTAIQAAATACRVAGGGRLYFPAGTYIINQSILIGSNTFAYGDGDVSVIKAKQVGFIGTAVGLNCYLFRNYNWSVTALTDNDIIVQDLKFDYGTVTIFGGGAHCIAMRYVDRVIVDRVTSEKGENCTAFLACRDTWTNDSIANLATNCGFDHWDGAAEAHVTNCTVRGLAGTSAQGIQFTGTGTALEDRDSRDILVEGCSVYDINQPSGFASGIIANANDAGSTVRNARFVNNNVVSCDNGIVVAGNGGGHMIIGNKIRLSTQCAILLQDEGSGRVPSDVTIINNDFNACDASVGGVALIAVGGGAGHFIAHNRGNGGTYNYWCWLASGATQATVIDNVIPNGTLGTVLNQGGATNRIRAVSSVLPALGDYGSINGDGTTLNNAAVTAAEASTTVRISTPEGVYRTTAAASGTALSKVYTGPGQIKTNDGNALIPNWRVITSKPAEGNHNYILTAGNGDAQKVQNYIGTWVSNATTLTQPATGYKVVYETAGRIGEFLVANDAGWNQSTTGNDGRTGYFHNVTDGTQAGNGDAGAYYTNIFVSGVRSAGVGGPGTPTDALAMPAGVVHGGQVTAGANDVFLNNFEQNAADNGYRASAAPFVTNLTRTNASTTNNQFWLAFSAQSKGSVAADVAYRMSGKFNFGIDATIADFGANKAFIVMKQNDRIYGNSSVTDGGLFQRFCSVLGTTWFENSSSAGGWLFVHNNTSVVIGSNAAFTALVPFNAFNTNYQVNGTTVIDADRGFRFAVYTAANIAAIGNAVNTANKVEGKAVWDSTNRRIMVADGSTPASLWWVSDGSASVTPV